MTLSGTLHVPAANAVLQYAATGGSAIFAPTLNPSSTGPVRQLHPVANPVAVLRLALALVFATDRMASSMPLDKSIK